MHSITIGSGETLKMKSDEMGIAAGLLNEVIEVWREVKTKNEYGANKIEYQKAYSTRAKVTHNSGVKEINEHELLTHYEKTFTVRFYHDIKDTDRIKWYDTFYQVLSVEPDRDKQHKIVEAEKVNM